MNLREAEAKYGKENLKKMQEHLNGITVCINPKTGEEDIPDSDLERAYDIITKGKSNIPWD